MEGLRRECAGRRDVAFVPTMGSLHEGHKALLREARLTGGFVVASVFVNPTQFGPGEDFDAYPRDEAGDLAALAEAGCDVAFLPTAAELYADGGTRVLAGAVASRWEGELRPGHFDGVATVLAKLFGAVGPCRAYFGLKDLQQCAVVRALVEDLMLPVELRWVETVREPSGLALSSRNRYFTDEQRAGAAALYAALSACATGESSAEEARHLLAERGFDIEYLACVDPRTMQELPFPAPGARWIAAARYCGVRLIDNIAAHTA